MVLTFVAILAFHLLGDQRGIYTPLLADLLLTGYSDVDPGASWHMQAGGRW